MRGPIHWLLRPTLDNTFDFGSSIFLNFLRSRENALLDDLITCADDLGVYLSETLISHKLAMNEGGG
jgi:hypothetical protein